MGTATFSSIHRVSVGGANKCCLATLTMSSSYATGGDTLDLSTIPFSIIDSVLPHPLAETSEFVLAVDTTTPTAPKMKASKLTGTITGGTAAAQSFTGTAPTSDLNLATPAFSGTGLTAAGQVITTTSAHTMTLNQCAGMWLLSATGSTAPNLIKSNTAVAGAAAVLTVYGSANTDAGAYSIVKALTPVGANAASAVTGSTGSAAITEVTATTDLSAVTSRVLVFGRD